MFRFALYSVPSRSRFPALPFLAFFLIAGVGCAPDEEGSAGASAVSSSDVSPDGLRFAHVTEEVGLGAFRHVTGAFGEMWFPETMGSGAGFLDYDGDGWQDIVLVSGAVWPDRDEISPPALRLYRNEGGSFSDRTIETGLAGLRAYGMGVAIADYDNDGDPDIFLSTIGRNLLLRNDRKASPERFVTFVEVGGQTGLGDREEWSASSIFFDADLDGDADLYVGNYVAWSPETDIWCTIDGETKTYCTAQFYDGLPGRFYRNDGHGAFSDRTVEAGFLPMPSNTLGVAEWDFNEDGWPDIVVANDMQRDLLYMNDRNGVFTEQGVASGIAFDENGKARGGMGIDVGVIDDTGAPSVVIGHFTNEMIGVYRQIAPGLFLDRAAQSRTGQSSLPTLTFGLGLFDADLDGDMDMILANGHISPDIEGLSEGVFYRQRPQLFVNEGDGFFSEHTPAPAGPMAGRALALADYDRDGDEDILITENGGPVHLLRNDTRAGGFLRVRLEGSRANRDALGAHVTAVAGDRRMQRRVRTGSSYLVSSDKTLTFGLGAAAQVDTLVVHWPGGETVRYANLPAGREVHIVEGSDDVETVILGSQPRP